jgi:hypothetical protein
MAINGYQEAFGLVSKSAKALADMTGRHPAADAQIREGVRLLRKMRDDAEPEKNIEVLQALIESRLRPSWTTDQQAEYDRKKQILEWRDFFVSYTNRDAAQTNQQFRNLIKSCLGIVPKGKDNETNHLARVITRHLRRYQGLSGFFDEDELKVGESINEEVDQYCTKAFALVQLIEPLTFEKEPPRNWCFYEYQRFSQNQVVVGLLGDKDRHFFILTDALPGVTPASPVPMFDKWFSRISTLKKSQISLDGERNITLRAKLKAIATEILALRAEIVDAWLK